jgi:hypothetical protein
VSTLGALAQSLLNSELGRHAVKKVRPAAHCIRDEADQSIAAWLKFAGEIDSPPSFNSGDAVD